MIDVSIVIVSYNVRSLLDKCLGALAADESGGGASPGMSTEILLVDNASGDGSADLVRAKYPSVHLIENGENRGFAAANNQAFAASCGRYVFMLNPDAIARPSAVEGLVKFMDGEPAAGACGGGLLYPDGSFQHAAFRFPTLAQIFLDFFPVNWRLTESRLNGRYPRRRYTRGQPFEIDHPLGAALMVRRQAVEQVGWLDEGFFIYCEEIDWCLRIKQAGWKVWCVPSSQYVHYEGQSTRQFREAMYVELWRARFRLFSKHYSPVFQMAAREIVRLGLAKETRRARKQARSGQLSEDDLRSRLEAYGQVAALSRGG